MRGRRLLRIGLIPLAAAALTAPVAPAAAGDGGLSAEEATRVADRDAKVREQRRRRGELSASAALVDGRWEVSYYAGEERVALTIVDRAGGAVVESWTGHQVDWKMARGYEGAFGRRLNAPYVFLPLCALFLIGLVDWRRPWRAASLDLLALLGFGLSHAFFNRGEIGVSVPLQYPVLAYLLARMLWIGLRGRRAPLAPAWPAAWLLIAALFLTGVRVGLNLADSGVIDVGYASVVGADLIAGGETPYGSFPGDVSQGDTYGPFTYLAYLPFELIWPLSGEDELAAAHAAAVAFDLLAMGLLVLLAARRAAAGGRMRWAATLAFGWAAYPYTAFALESNSNDALVAALLVAALLLLGRPAGGGVATALAALAKLAPALLAPLFAGHEAQRGRRRALAFAFAFAATAAALLAWPALDPGPGTVWERTVAYQAGRDSPFSIWGQVDGLEPLRVAVLGGALAMAVLFAFLPRRKDLARVAALGAALLIAVQLAAQHWFYLYIVWFYPLLLVALSAPAAGSGRAPASGPGRPT